MDTYDKQYIFTIFPDLFKLKDFIYEFKKAINGKNPDAISRWVDNVILSESFSSLISLANGMKRDIEPIKNSIIYTATNAFLEGNVNRLKMIKRTMYGRAGYDLLRSKVVELTSFY
jgi:transposase